MRYILEVNNVSKAYKNKIVVNQLDLSIKEGEIYGLLGPNGSGKTTSIQMITGITRANSGKIKIHNLDVQSNQYKIKKLIGVIPDSDDLLDDLTTREYLQFISSVREIPRKKADQNIERWLQIMELSSHKNKMLGSFSHGMRKKVQIISALLHQPSILIIDEPTNGLDPDMIIFFKDILKKLRLKNISILLSTHHLTFAQDICDTVHMIKEGETITQGKLVEVLSQAEESSLEKAYIKLTNTNRKGEELNEVLADWENHITHVEK